MMSEVAPWAVVALCLAPVAVQGALMVVDEFYFHHKRGLGLWERRGHPLDTLSVLACFVVPAVFPFGLRAGLGYAALCLFSSAFVTKDEWVHAEQCDPAEQWLHALLFVVHPLVFVGFGFLWFARPDIVGGLLMGQIALMGVVLTYQVLFWVVLGKGRWPRTVGQL